MRTTADRVRHTLLFEAIAIALMSAVGTLVLDRGVIEFGALSVMMSALAMSWNYFFWLFDHGDRRLRQSRPRGVGLRVVHACLYEAGILIAGTFLVAWWLVLPWWDAFVLDLGFAAFFLVYAFVYNWVYDVVFPVDAGTAISSDVNDSAAAAPPSNSERHS